MAERADLYAHVPPLVRPIPIEVAPLPVDDNIPGEEEISGAVLGLRLHCARGPSGMRAEYCSEKLHLQSYLEMLWSETGCFGLLGNNIILFIILLYLIER